MASVVNSFSLAGIDAYPVKIETDTIGKDYRNLIYTCLKILNIRQFLDMYKF